MLSFQNVSAHNQYQAFFMFLFAQVVLRIRDGSFHKIMASVPKHSELTITTVYIHFGSTCICNIRIVSLNLAYFRLIFQVLATNRNSSSIQCQILHMGGYFYYLGTNSLVILCLFRELPL